MAKFTVTTPNELDIIIETYCKVTGRTRNGLCLQWIQDGAIEAFKKCREAGLISDDWSENTTLSDNDQLELHEENED